ncbi:thymidylate kinase [Actinacidiphila alni]|uniref:thymidylate kinase n=1 Tax=Actinacidiphila alni TaxID=380248 RepID=UPI0033DA33B5
MDGPPPYPFIVLEGVSGIGKSTLARALTKRMHGTSLHTLPAPHSDWSAAVNEQLRALPQFAFYVSGLLHAADRARTARRTGPVVADRYTSSVTVCHSAVHAVPLTDVTRLLEPFRTYLEPPSHSYYLSCSEEALRERMAGKPDAKQDDVDLFAVPGRLPRLLATFQQAQAADPTAVALDTDGKSAEDLAALIIAHLEVRGA